MRRRLFTLASALSLLLCLATAIFWFKTRGGIERFMVFHEKSGRDVWVGGGRVAIMWYFGDEHHSMVPMSERSHYFTSNLWTIVDARDPKADYDWHWAGFLFRHQHVSLSHWGVGVPVWFPCAVFAALRCNGL